jgi:hypothetical protein
MKVNGADWEGQLVEMKTREEYEAFLAKKVKLDQFQSDMVSKKV